mgnify:FL=1
MKKAAATRLNILQKAFELVYVKGYQTTSIDEILATTQVTKGAFYYHFKNKDEMGIAIINELLKPTFEINFLEPLRNLTGDPSVMLYDMMYGILMENEVMTVEHGCPASNFTQEMAPWNVDFTAALNGLSNQWKQAIADAVERGKQNGYVRQDVDGEQVAVFVLSGYWGIRNMGKLVNNESVYVTYLQQFKSYLESLR